MATIKKPMKAQALRMPPAILKRLNRAATKEYLSFNAWAMRTLIAEADRLLGPTTKENVK
jgi:predicted HicB family RNase H-like nuclease